MNGNDLLERRAERGTHRGAANVWTDAQPTSPSSGTNGSMWMFRAALAAWMVAIGTLAILAVTNDDVVDTANSEAEDAPAVSSEPLPEPILVEGMTLARVNRPFNSDFDGDDILDDPRFTQGETQFTSPDGRLPDSTVVFAHPTDPFNNPIIGLQLLEGGGFRPWSANADEGELESYVDQLVSDNGTWTIPNESDLDEVARFSSTVDDHLELGWQFDFIAGSNAVTLQAETTRTQESANVWLWVARSVGEDTVGPKITAVEILGENGIRIERDSDDADVVVWTGDGGFVYRLTADRLDGDRYIARNASDEIQRLQKVDRNDWVVAVNAAERVPASQTIVVILAALILLGLVVGLIIFLIKREFRIAGAIGILLALQFATGIGFLSSETRFQLLLLALVGVGSTLWWAKKQAAN